jgi:hypothetical protein
MPRNRILIQEPATDSKKARPEPIVPTLLAPGLSVIIMVERIEMEWERSGSGTIILDRGQE